MRYRRFRLLGTGICLFLLMGLPSQTRLYAVVNVVVDYTFDDESSLDPFTKIGMPEVEDGQLKLNGSSYLEIADPLAGALDNYVVEGIFTADSFDDFDFGFARNDPTFDPAPGDPESTGNNGQGLLFQDFDGGIGQTKVLNSFSGLTGGPGVDPDPFNLPVGIPFAIAAVQNGGVTELYINGIKLNNPASNDAIRGTPTTLGIGSHPFDGAAGAFNGKIDRFRITTFAPGALVSPDDFIVVEPSIALELNTSTGEAVLTTIGPFPGNVIAYDITSGADVAALAPANWTSIADNYDANSGPTGDVQVDTNNNWTEFPGSSTSIAEAELNDPSGDGAQFGAALSMSLGEIWIPNPFAGVTMELLFDDGTRTIVPILYDGLPSNPVVLGDYSGNGVVDAADWPTIRDNFRADVSGLAPAVGYNMGDMNRDGVVDVLDFGEFKSLFIAAQGAQAFQDLLAGSNVPEPSSCVLLTILGFTVVAFRRRSTSVSSSVRRQLVKTSHLSFVLAVSMGFLLVAAKAEAASTADAIYRLGEDDPGAVNGGTATSTNDLIGGGFSLPAGGTGNVTYSNNTPSSPPTPPPASTLSASFNNSNFLESSNSFVTAGTVVPGGSNSGLDGVDNFGIEAWVYANSFASSGPIFDFVVNNGTGGPGIDGEPSTGYGLLHDGNDWSFLRNGVAHLKGTTAPVTGEWVHLAGVMDNGTARLFVNGVEENSADATGALPRDPGESPTTSRLTIGANPFDAPSDLGLWDGEIDHVRLFSFEPGEFEPDRDLSFNTLVEGDVLPALLTLEITRGTGAGVIKNDSVENFDIDYYTIESSTGAANPSWTGLAPAATAPGNGWEKLGTPSTSLIEQAFLDGSAEILVGASASLGGVYTGSSQADEDGITFSYRTTAGTVRTGLISFVDAVNVPGDYNGNGIVDSADYAIWLNTLGQSVNPGEVADGDGSGTVDVADYAFWKARLGNTAGSGTSNASVPEPTTGILATLAGLVALCFRARRSLCYQLCSAGPTEFQVQRGSVYALVGLITCSSLQAAVTLDRDYELGDNPAENATLGQVVGSAAPNVSFDSAGVSLTGNIQVLDQIIGNPTYADVSGRPFANVSDNLGAEFDGNDYLLRANNDFPQQVFQKGGLGFPGNDPPQNPYDNYATITTRGIRAWVNPTSSGSQARQDIVNDTYQFGIHISENDTWAMTWGSANGGTEGLVVESDAPVAFNTWSHVQQHSFDAGSAALYVNGVAVATSGINNSVAYQTHAADADLGLTVGASLDGSNAFTGTIDDVEIYVAGDNTGVDPIADRGDGNPIPQPGMNYGAYTLQEDNGWIAENLASLGVTDVADVNVDGSVNSADITAFLPGWKFQNLVDGVQLGDWNSRQNGDLNYDGIVDLDDVFILHDGLVAAGVQSGFPFSALTNVPEPSTMSLIAISSVGMLLHRKRPMNCLTLITSGPEGS